MADNFAQMKDTNKAPYLAPGMGNVDLMLERAILTMSDVQTPVYGETNEGVNWVVDF